MLAEGSVVDDLGGSEGWPLFEIEGEPVGSDKLKTEELSSFKVVGGLLFSRSGTRDVAEAD